MVDSPFPTFDENTHLRLQKFTLLFRKWGKIIRRGDSNNEFSIYEKLQSPAHLRRSRSLAVVRSDPTFSHLLFNFFFSVSCNDKENAR